MCPINSVYEGLYVVKKKIAELEQFHRSLRDKRQADRVKTVIALSKGWSATQVAEILLFDEKTSRHYFERYQQGGLQVLLDDNYSGAEPKLDEHQMSELEGYLEEQTPYFPASSHCVRTHPSVRFCLTFAEDIHLKSKKPRLTVALSAKYRPR